MSHVFDPATTHDQVTHPTLKKRVGPPQRAAGESVPKQIIELGDHVVAAVFPLTKTVALYRAHDGTYDVRDRVNSGFPWSLELSAEHCDPAGLQKLVAVLQSFTAKAD